jgi:hypothetical protein
MLRRHTFWLKGAVGLMALTAVIHGTSLFVTPVADNDTERQLLELMQSHRIDAGAGFHPSMRNLMTALSSCFSFVYLLGAATTWHLLRARVGVDVLRGFVAINVVVFGAAFAVMLAFTFLPPIVLTALVEAFLVGGWLTLPRG